MEARKTILPVIGRKTEGEHVILIVVIMDWKRIRNRIFLVVEYYSCIQCDLS